jgi:predicted pyridoxine 5'-phosphate oxidase superfamily flavin-nucleotide-binding protein
MADQTEMARQFAQVLKTGGSNLTDLLTEDVTFASLNVDIRGREAVLRRLVDQDTGRTYREATWVDAKPHGEAIQITARMPDTAPHSGNILLLQFRDKRVAAIRQQSLLPARPAQSEPLHLTDELKNLVNSALATRHPMLLTHVDESGQPVLSFRGSTQVFSDDQFAIWVRNSGGGLVRSIAKNPKVALMYRDEDKKTTFQFQGRAWIATSDRERQQVYKASHKVEQDHDFAEVGVAMVIDLDRIEGYFALSPAGQVGKVNMRRTAS